MKEPFTKKEFLIFSCLTLAGIAVNFLPFTLHYRIDLIFGSVFALLAVYLLPPVAGITAATLIALPTIYLWHHPLAVIFFAIEAICISLLLRKTRMHLLACSAITWLLVMPPIIYTVMSASSHYFPSALQVLILKYIVNGIFNATLASSLLCFVNTRLNNTDQVTNQIKASEAAVNFFVIVTVFPLLMFMMLDSKLLFESFVTNIQSRQASMQKAISFGIKQWINIHQSAIKHIASKASESENIDGSYLQETVKNIFLGFRDFKSIYVADQKGITTAFYPTTHPEGPSNIGLDFSDRPYFQTAKATMQSVITGVFLGRGKDFYPLVGMAEPIIINQQFAGLVLGAMEPAILQDYLKDLIDKGVSVTIIDADNLVVFSNKQIKIAEKYDFTAFNKAEPGINGSRLLFPETNIAAATKYWLSVMIFETAILEPKNWRLIIEEPMAVYIESLFAVSKHQFSNILALIICILLFSSLIRRFFSRPLEKLLEVTSSIARTGFCEMDVTMPTSKIYEIQTLNENFAAALATINKAQQAEKEQNIRLSEANLSLHDKINLLNAAQRHIEQSEKNLAVLLNSSPFSIIIADADGKVKYINEEFRQQAGTNGVASTLKDIFANFYPYGAMGFAIEAFMKELTSSDKSEKAITTGELCMLNKREPAIFNCIATLDEDRCIIILSDVTQVAMAHEEKRRLEDQLQTTQRFESLGILAGGVAHDFNNILQSILGFAELTLVSLPTGSRLRENLEEIEAAATRAAYLTNQMLAYTGHGSMTTKPFDLTELVREMTALLTVSVSQLVTIKFNFQESLVWAMGDPSQIRQVVMNMVVNASEAIGDTPGQITVSTGLVKQNDYHLQEATVFHGNPDCRTYAYFEIIDTGCGIEAKLLTRIFDPFYTTKFTGRGLGLAATMGIIKAHEGAIFVSSAPRQGSCFRIMLPAARETMMEVSEDADTHESSEKIPIIGSILLVDDEETVLTITELMLEPSKVRLIKARNGEEALEIFAREHERIALVILDLVMPRMKGEVAFKEMKRIDPAIPIIISSGYTIEETVTRLESAKFDGFIQKPFRRTALLQEIVRVAGLAPDLVNIDETVVNHKDSIPGGK